MTLDPVLGVPSSPFLRVWFTTYRPGSIDVPFPYKIRVRVEGRRNSILILCDCFRNVMPLV